MFFNSTTAALLLQMPRAALLLVALVGLAAAAESVNAEVTKPGSMSSRAGLGKYSKVEPLLFQKPALLTCRSSAWQLQETVWSMPAACCAVPPGPYACGCPYAIHWLQ